MKRGDVISLNGNKATVKWVVDHEIGVLHDNGQSSILNLMTEEGKKWVVTLESSPVYQTSVEHMTDEQLRNSIEELRRKRIIRPEATRTRVKSAVTIETPESKQLKSILGNKTEAEKQDLMRKLGMLD